MVVLSSETGMVRAVLLDNGHLTDIRTAATGAVAARHLSRPDAAHACILGAGTQARLQLEALTLVRPIRSAAIWARATRPERRPRPRRWRAASASPCAPRPTRRRRCAAPTSW